MGDIGKIVKSLGFVEEFVAVTAGLSTEHNIDELLIKVINSACRFTQCDGGRIYMLDVTRKYLEIKVAQWRGKAVGTDWYRDISLTLGSCSWNPATRNDPLVYVVLTGNSLVIDSVAAAANMDQTRIYDHDRCNGVKTVSYMLVPLINHERQTIGILELVNARDNKYNRVVSFKPLEAVVKAFASQAAICINNALLIDRNEKLIEILDHSNRLLAEDNKKLRELNRYSGEYRVIGNSESMTQLYKMMDKVVCSEVTVLLRGETGTGKEVIAREIHRHSPRKHKPFVTQNCAALPEQLLESELFGFKKGAFTGAFREKKGLFDVADNGTLFLDEIGDMPIALQSKLLRVLQENEIRPLGATQSHKINVRIIAATHCDLEGKIKSGTFREDLFFRLSVFPLELPALRQRGNDIVILARYFIKHCQQQYQRRIAGISPAAVELLMHYSYPGNVRELQNLIERAVLLCEDGGAILPEYLPDHMKQSQTGQLQSSLGYSGEPESCLSEPKLSETKLPETKPLKQAVNDFECDLIQRHLQVHNWNQTQTARALQIPRRTLIDKMNRFNIRTPDRKRRGPKAS